MKAFSKLNWVDLVCIVVAVSLVHPVLDWLGWEDNFVNYFIAWVAIFLVTAIVLVMVRHLFNNNKHDTTGTDTTD